MIWQLKLKSVIDLHIFKDATINNVTQCTVAALSVKYLYALRHVYQ